MQGLEPALFKNFFEKTQEISLYWFAAQQQISTLRLQKFDWFYVKKASFGGEGLSSFVPLFTKYFVALLASIGALPFTTSVPALNAADKIVNKKSS